MLQASKENSKRLIGVVTSSVILLIAIAIYAYVMYPGANFIESKPMANAGVEEMHAASNTVDLEKALEVNEQGLSQATVMIQTTRGKIKYKFYSKDAPKTVRRMAELIQKGFYNGLVFHRVIPGFVAQGGDPTGSGMGGSGVKLAAEFNSRKHVPGAVAMARAQDPDSADSQFYIMLGTHPQLDGNYTVFGQVIEGQDIASQLQIGDRMTAVTLELP